jgi:hypothetical protein
VPPTNHEVTPPRAVAASTLHVVRVLSGPARWTKAIPAGMSSVVNASNG